jgi:hypothetical protein
MSDRFLRKIAAKETCCGYLAKLYQCYTIETKYFFDKWKLLARRPAVGFYHRDEILLAFQSIASN